MFPCCSCLVWSSPLTCIMLADSGHVTENNRNSSSTLYRKRVEENLWSKLHKLNLNPLQQNENDSQEIEEHRQHYILGFLIVVWLSVCSITYAVMIRDVYTVIRMNRQQICSHTRSLQQHAGWTTGLGIYWTGQNHVIVISVTSWERAHGQSVLLINGVQLLCAHSVSDELKLLRECLTAVCHTDVRDVGTTDVVA